MNVPLKRYIDLLGEYMLPQRWLVAGLAVGLFANIALQLVNPQILRYFIDTAVDTSADAPPLSAITYAAIAFLSVAILVHLISIVTSYLGGSIAWNATNALREDLASHCLRLDMSFHKSRTPGELIQRIDGDVGVLGNYFSTFLITIIGNVILLAGSLSVLYVEKLMVGLVLTVSSVVMLSIVYSMRSIAVQQNVALFQSFSELYGFIEERLSGKEDVRASGATAYVLRRLYELVRNVYRKTLSSGYRSILIQWTMMTSFALNHAIALALGAYLFLTDQITLGTVFMIIQYIRLLQGPLISITGQVQALQQFRASVERVEELFGTKNAITDGEGPDLPGGPLSVAFEHVDFSYGEDDDTLKDVSFALESGKVLGLLGKTGSGKTTLARMLFRFYDPKSGHIRLAGNPIKECPLNNLRSRIGMVTQDVQLFRASVRDNLTFFDPTVPDEAILQAIAKLGLTSWLEALPDGLNTKLGSSDLGLSGGEAQLLAFTRVFLSKPGLIILDEASSRLDPATEELMERAMDELLADQTAIVIAHRLETVKRADDIIILDDGLIAEIGARRDLERDEGSRFSRLLKMGLTEGTT
jgi:ATP-binding cassette subfamily B protein